MDDVSLSYTAQSTEVRLQLPSGHLPSAFSHCLIIFCSILSMKANSERSQGDFLVPDREHWPSSYSAPIFAEKKYDPAEKIRQMQNLSALKPNSYVLPTPNDGKVTTVSRSKPAGLGANHNLSHSSPLEQRKQEARPALELKDGKHNGLSQLPPPLTVGPVSDIEKSKRQAFSGPLMSKPVMKKPVLSASGPISSSELPQLVSGIVSRSTQPSSSPKVSPNASPPLVSSPRISELHELPRPPGNKPTKSYGYSAPLVFRNQESSTARRIPSTASPLPAPPVIVSRSFSIPSSSQRAMGFNVAKILEPPRFSSTAREASSPPLTPLSLSQT